MPGRALALVLAALLVAPTLASAQGGHGGGQGFGRRGGRVDEGPDRVGKYGLARSAVHALVGTPDAWPALAAYEAAMKEAERRGALGTAARAGAAAVLLANRLGMLQKVLTLGASRHRARPEEPARPGGASTASTARQSSWSHARR